MRNPLCATRLMIALRLVNPIAGDDLVVAAHLDRCSYPRWEVRLGRLSKDVNNRCAEKAKPPAMDGGLWVKID